MLFSEIMQYSVSGTQKIVGTQKIFVEERKEEGRKPVTSKENEDNNISVFFFLISSDIKGTYEKSLGLNS